MEPEQENVEGEMVEVDVAEMMGFASFGRKRKHADSPIASRPAPGLQSTNAANPQQHPIGNLPVIPPPSLPAKPPSAGAHEHHTPASGASRHQGRTWWVGYYDPTSNENPWEILERREGLEPLGSWLPRGHARQEQRRRAGGAQEAPGDAAGQVPAEGGE